MEGYIAAAENSSIPCHPESERSVLGSMLRSREAALLAIETLQPDDFYDPANREVYAAMLAIATTSQPINLVTLDEELSRRREINALRAKMHRAARSEDYETAAKLRDELRRLEGGAQA